MATEGRRKVCVAPFMRDRDLGGESVVRAWRQGQNHKSRKLAKLSIEKNGMKKTMQKGGPYHSPPAVPSALREESWVLPAAAEAKLEGSGVGIMKFDRWLKERSDSAKKSKE